jgi:TP901 family phage tail tape measure protein
MAVSKEQLIIQLKAQGITATKAQLKGLHKSVNQTGKGMAGMAGQMAIATVGFYAAARAIGSVISTGKEFQQSMANVKAISGATGVEFAMLEKNAKSLGATTVHTASDVAALQTEFAKLGFTATEITKVTEGTLALSTAVGADLATSAATAGTTLRGFGLDVEETNRVTDVMALSFSSSALDMAKFTDSMKYVAPIAKATGVDLEGTTAILGQLANAGISGSMAGTSLRKILLEAGNAGSALAKRMGGPITSFEDFTEKIVKLKADGLDPLSEGADLVGKRAVTAFSILLEGADDVNELGTALNSAAGSAQDMAEIQLDTLEGSLKLATSAMDGLKITIFEMNEGALKESVELFTKFIDSIDEEELRAMALSVKLLGGAYALYRTHLLLAAIANKQFTLSLTKTGIGAIVVALGLAIAAIIDYTDVLKIEKTEEEKAMEAAIAHSKALKDQTDRVNKLAGAYRDMDLEEQQREYNKLNNILLDLGPLYAEYNEELVKNRKKLQGNITDEKEYKKIKADISADEKMLAAIEVNIEKYGEEMGAVHLVIEEYRALQQAKLDATSGGEDGDDVEVKIPGIPTDTEMEEATARMSDFYMNQHMLTVDKLALEEATMIQAAEDAAGFEGASQEEISAIEAIYDKKREKTKDAIFKADLKRGAASVSNTLGNLAAANQAFKGSADVTKGILGAQALMNTYSSAVAAYNSVVGIPIVGPGLAVAAATAAVIAGLANVRMIEQTSTSQFAEGGLISGPGHSGGGVNINAEGGEFVMKRDAVDAVGLETMNAINEGGGGGSVVVNVSGNVMSQDYVEGELVDQLKEALRRGSDLGIS